MSHSTLCSIFVAEVELSAPATVVLPCLNDVMDSHPSRTMSQNKLFLLLVALAMLFNHSSRKITDTHKHANIRTYTDTCTEICIHTHANTFKHTYFKLPPFGEKEMMEEVSYYTIKSLAYTYIIMNILKTPTTSH